MGETKYLEDIASIKTIMSKSSRFMSLSGLSGILAGVYALIGAFAAYRLLESQKLPSLTLQGISTKELSESPSTDLTGFDGLLAAFTGGDVNILVAQLLYVGLIVLIVSVATGVFLTLRKAKKNDENLWDASSKRLIINFAIPLFIGGAFCLVLIQYGIVGLIAPATLIFYGLALLNASKYTLGDIKYLGIANMIIGLIATQFIGYGLYFWALGFGILHIIYGWIMYNKYDKRSGE